MGKARVGVRLKEAVGAKKSHYKSEDLAKLNEKYDVFTKQLAGLIAALKAHNASQVEYSKTRFQVRRIWYKFYVQRGSDKSFFLTSLWMVACTVCVTGSSTFSRTRQGNTVV